MNTNNQAVPVIFGEVLYDRFPDGNAVLGGAPFNVAWHMQAFGMAPLVVSRVGDDALGDSVKSAMDSWHMDTGGLQTDHEHPTGVVDIVFDDDEPRYTIVENSAWDFVDASLLPALPDRRVLYHGSLALRSATSRAALDKIRSDHRGLVFMDVNLRDPWWDGTAVKAWASEADWVKLNRDELEVLGEGEGTTLQQARAFLGAHGLTGLVVTLGADGALALAATGETAQAAPEKSLQVVDTVGAGDAFTSVLITGIMRQWPLQQTMERAQAFASRIVGRQGATVQAMEFYAPLKREWGM